MLGEAGGIRGGPLGNAALYFSAAALLLVIVLAIPASALAWDPACGGVETARATRKVNPDGRAPLAIGDSTMLLALPTLSRAGYKVNARGCRGWSEGMRLMRKSKRQGKLPHLTLIALGADYSITGRDIDKALRIAGPKRVLALLVPRELGGGTSSDADAVRHAGRQHKKRVMVLDWVKYSSSQGGWFQPDGLHLTFSGADAFARLARKATPYARAGKFPKGAHAPR